MRDRQGNPLRTVWVLGAGFSRSLNGPLLSDLFRQESLDDLRNRYPHVSFLNLAEACWWTQLLFNWGKHREGRWDDAESFADRVDCAQERSTEAASLLAMCHRARELDGSRVPIQKLPTVPAPTSLQQLQGYVIRALAAECSWFARNPGDRPERWDPYKRWAASLDPKFDKVVSFNYDQVVESLDPERKKLRDLLPTEVVGSDDEFVPLMKLHGSVLWLRDGAGCRREPLDTVLGSPEGFFALGTPGSSKRRMKDNVFEPLWAAAERAIRAAEAIVFLGYRFPETDGDARRRILDAIRTNTRRRLRCQIVLGVDRTSVDSTRVLRMLEVCTREDRDVYIDDTGESITQKTAELLREPLFAQDYLALYADSGPISHWR